MGIVIYLSILSVVANKFFKYYGILEPVCLQATPCGPFRMGTVMDIAPGGVS
jgi:hypothetical protein